MSFWDGSFRPAKKEWYWEELRVWNPRTRCNRSNKQLFLKKAFRGRLYVDWTFQTEIWLSRNAYTVAVLKGDFDD